jgi:hypothetical protein
VTYAKQHRSSVEEVGKKQQRKQKLLIKAEKKEPLTASSQ